MIEKREPMIKKLEVAGLNGKVNANLEFHEDLNIITGTNGSGKTTLLKLIWYLISGQIDRVLYIPFDFVSIETDRFELSISPDDHHNDEFLIEWCFKDSGAETEFRGDSEMEVEESLYIGFWDVQSKADPRIEDLQTDIRDIMKSSLFFPSFRRIESSFSRISQDMNSMRQTRRSRHTGSTQTRDPLQTAMSQQSVEQSVYSHKFVTSFSTTDIVELLSQKQTEISEGINAIYAKLSRDLGKKIPAEAELSRDLGKKNPAELAIELQEANSVLQQIQQEFTNAVSEEQKLQNQLPLLHGLINEIFDYGIKIEDGFTLGEEDGAISSDILSYGEQQMLSFLCYNAFSDNTVVFIDEPELSLHIRWQRVLPELLVEQQTTNQFFLATHSPSIFSKYPDKEFLLAENRGNEE